MYFPGIQQHQEQHQELVPSFSVYLTPRQPTGQSPSQNCVYRNSSSSSPPISDFPFFTMESQHVNVSPPPVTAKELAKVRKARGHNYKMPLSDWEMRTNKVFIEFYQELTICLFDMVVLLDN